MHLIMKLEEKNATLDRLVKCCFAHTTHIWCGCWIHAPFACRWKWSQMKLELWFITMLWEAQLQDMLSKFLTFIWMPPSNPSRETCWMSIYKLLPTSSGTLNIMAQSKHGNHTGKPTLYIENYALIVCWTQQRNATQHNTQHNNMATGGSGSRIPRTCIFTIRSISCFIKSKPKKLINFSLPFQSLSLSRHNISFEQYPITGWGLRPKWLCRLSTWFCQRLIHHIQPCLISFPYLSLPSWTPLLSNCIHSHTSIQFKHRSFQS